jgi:uncharacterized protein (DUF885 family)
MRWILVVGWLLAVAAPASGRKSDDWIARSNALTAELTAIEAKYVPELASLYGATQYDADSLSLWPDRTQAHVDDLRDVGRRFSQQVESERRRALRQDLEILVEAADRLADRLEVDRANALPYVNVAELAFFGFSSLLDEQVPMERRRKAVVRLRRYAGLEGGLQPIAEQAAELLRSRLADASLRAPFREQLEKDVANSARYLAGLAQLFEASGVEGWKEPLAAYQRQIEAYNAFLSAEVLPRASDDFRLREAEYRQSLRETGVDLPVEELVSRAKVSFREIQAEMQTLAALVAEERGLADGDYRSVIRELKKAQLEGDAILPFYRERLAKIEALVRDAGVVSLPKRAARIELGTEAESAATPAPHVRMPRLLGNTGEEAVFVLPLRIPAAEGKGELVSDDFTFDAAAWTLTVHEARPGHELQLAAILERGVSDARVLYAFNSTNVEGWALYMEAEMKPLLPLEGQLISLQHRLMRAARAFLDPSLQLGWISRDEAQRVLADDVVLSPAMTLQELERYTFRAPGQAPSYFCGYTRLLELRVDAERRLGARFDRRSYHDFLVAQGLLPPALLREAVMQKFVAGKD